MHFSPSALARGEGVLCAEIIRNSQRRIIERPRIGSEKESTRLHVR